MSAVKQSQFIAKHESQWQHFEEWLNYQELSRWQKNSKKKTIKAPEDLDMPHVYRQICHHFALASSRMYSPILVEKLNRLVLRGHQKLYSTRTHFWRDILEFFAGGFPALIRQEWRVVSIAAALFYIPFIAIIIILQYYPDLIYSIMDGSMVQSLERMYDPDLHERIGREREADTDLSMFGFYIKHNIGIDFQMFAGGMLFGIGSIFFLLFNGLFLGAAFGHLTHIGYIDTFWGFVVGHGAFELQAAFLSGAAGLKLAEALIMPGRKSRGRALVDNGKIAVKMMYGIVAMSLIAAFLEAFWSSMVMPVMIKYVVGAILWSLVAAYFIFLGRNNEHNKL
ncbi:MAG TPA: stage II sporulation protein M [Leucothrix sp.]|nr:stage II sporulation protein M [Leucothrix sp.]